MVEAGNTLYEGIFPFIDSAQLKALCSIKRHPPGSMCHVISSHTTSTGGETQKKENKKKYANFSKIAVPFACAKTPQRHSDSPFPLAPPRLMGGWL